MAGRAETGGKRNLSHEQAGNLINHPALDRLLDRTGGRRFIAPIHGRVSDGGEADRKSPGHRACCADDTLGGCRLKLGRFLSGNLQAGRPFGVT